MGSRDCGCGGGGVGVLVIDGFKISQMGVPTLKGRHQPISPKTVQKLRNLGREGGEHIPASARLANVEGGGLGPFDRPVAKTESN